MSAPPLALSVLQGNTHRPNTEGVIFFKRSHVTPTNIQIHPTQKTPVVSKFKMLIKQPIVQAFVDLPHLKSLVIELVQNRH